MMTLRMHFREMAFHKAFGKIGDTRGFSLVELIVVCVILGILATLVIPTYTKYLDQAKNVSAINDIREIDREIQSYYMSNNAFPPDLAAINRDTYKDPWGQPYIYKLNPTAAEALIGTFGWELNPDRDYDLYSKGSNRDSIESYVALTCDDDIVRANNGSVFGLRSNF